MCDETDEYSTFHNETHPRARKAHTCLGCDETIQPGQRYRYTSGLFDGSIYSYKHCMRCATMLDKLHERERERMRAEGYGGGLGTAIDPELNCGAIWKDPPEDVAALAFALPKDFAAA